MPPEADRGPRPLIRSTFQDRFYLHERGLWRHFVRDVRMAAYVFSVAWAWLRLGGRVRGAWRRARRAGEIYWIDPLDQEDL